MFSIMEVVIWLLHKVLLLNTTMFFQGFIVTSSQLANSSEFIASLGTQYYPGTSFTIVPGKS